MVLYPVDVYHVRGYIFSQTGPFTIILIPYPSNVMFGREGFRIHGDNVRDPGNGSDGCIVIDRIIRQQIWNGADHRLIVKV